MWRRCPTIAEEFMIFDAADDGAGVPAAASAAAAATGDAAVNLACRPA
jgi:hypothetical protein